MADGVHNSTLITGMENNDVLSLTVTNELPQTVKGLIICLVAYDSANRAKWPIATAHDHSISMGYYKRNLYMATWEEVDIESGGSKTVTIDCNHDKFTGVRALVARVTVEADGAETALDNPLLEDWYELALGSPTHYFD